jgi:hypothetical protein
LVSPLPPLPRNPSFSRPVGETIDAGTSYVTTAQPGVTHVVWLKEIGRPCTVSSGTPPRTCAWECQAGRPSRALTQSEPTCPFPRCQPGILSFWATPRPDSAALAVVCAK